MKDEGIKRAITAAKIFINRAESTLAERKMKPSALLGTKNSGSLRRMSMELSRCLSAMRNPR